MPSYVAGFRAYAWDDDIAELARRFFAACPSARKVVLMDETRGTVEVPGYEKVPHTEDTRSFGLPDHHPEGNSLWYNGDYAIYFLRRALPDFDYYLVSEWDLAVNISCEPMLEQAAASKLDAIVHQLIPSTPEWHWHESSVAALGNPWRAFLYFMCLSGRAVDHLLLARRRLARRFAAGGITQWPICESFMPSVLKAAPEMQFADVGKFASVENLRHRPHISLRDPRASLPGSLVHPVLGSERFIATLLAEHDLRDYFRPGSELREALNQEPFEAIVDSLRTALVESQDQAALAMLEQEIALRGLPREASFKPSEPPSRSRPMPAVDSVIRSMCVSEMAVWSSRHVNYDAALSEYEHLNATRHHIFLFEIHKGHVSIREKPEFYTSDQFAADLRTAFHSIPPWLRAAMMYRNLLSVVAETLCPDLDTIIAVDVGDIGMHSETAPLFGINKIVGQNSVLLPHFEFVEESYHENITDDIPYFEKSLSAMFAGSTTGLESIAVDAVRKLAVPRIRSAVFFKGHPLVDFRLPHIVQCTPEAEQLLRDMGFGTGMCPFEDHFANKFIISMDGNAGSCSRVSIALKSNCALLKYDSPYIMHYFPHLIPWFHYIPIHSDEDVNSAIEIERRFPGFFESIAIEGKKFFDNYICKQQIVNYTGALLRMYVDSFDHASRNGHRVDRAFPQAAPPVATLTGTPSMVSRSDVIEAYRTVLGRDPESEQAIQDHSAVQSIPELYRALIDSDEFREIVTSTRAQPGGPNLLLPLDLPPLEIQSQPSDATQLTAMFARISSAWTQLGQEDPFFSVCTDPRLLGAEIGEQRDAFYASGESDLRHLTSFAARSGIDLTGRSCVELGCGVGRVTRWLAALFRRVQALDISPGHLAIAQREMAEAGIENVSFVQIASLENLRQITGYDVFFSILVLQHNPPPLIAYFLVQLLTNLNPGGVGFFQVPTYNRSYSFRVSEYLSAPVPEEAEVHMHVLPQRDVLNIIRATGCRVLEVREDNYTGDRGGISNTFFVQKAL